MIDYRNEYLNISAKDGRKIIKKHKWFYRYSSCYYFSSRNRLLSRWVKASSFCNFWWYAIKLFKIVGPPKRLSVYDFQVMYIISKMWIPDFRGILQYWSEHAKVCSSFNSGRCFLKGPYNHKESNICLMYSAIYVFIKTQCVRNKYTKQI